MREGSEEEQTEGSGGNRVRGMAREGREWRIEGEAREEMDGEIREVKGVCMRKEYERRVEGKSEGNSGVGRKDGTDEGKEDVRGRRKRVMWSGGRSREA